ncbi:MAG TPA: FKBP-type peptidyl-prolyl cis-trans isomerase [Kofleriaceae bacterium]|nr:FKBP-type peptidyl-prolyl cis-trans isomerase [Kofleriaceae bacterium]
MRGLSPWFVSLALAAAACRGGSDSNATSSANGSQSTFGAGQGSGSAKPKLRGQQVDPPVPLAQPPADAVKTASGLIYKKLKANDTGPQPKRNDTVLINYTGWRQTTGDTFFTNKGRDQPLPLNLAQTAPGFTEGLQLMHKGETAMLWMPPSIGYKTPPTTGTPETLVYEVEIVDIQAAPDTPPDVAKPPANAEALPTAGKRELVKPGSFKDKAGLYDTVVYNYTAWDSDGKIIDSTEVQKRPQSAQPYKQPIAMTEMLTSMVAKERARFWVDAEKAQPESGRPLPVKTGTICYEVEVTSITRAQHKPPPTPSDVAKPPADAKKTEKGVFYKILKPAPAGGDPRHPAPVESVKVHYSGWTTDGRLFDSSELRGEPSTFNLNAVIAGWTDGLQVMTIGERARFWIPVELAYKNQPGKPKGMLVFEVELLDIAAPAPKRPPTGHGR